MKVELFRVEWDYSRTRIQPSDERYRRRELQGIRWANGVITLENGTVYSNLNEMLYTLRNHGKFTVTWTHDVDENRALLGDACVLLKAYRETLSMRFPGDNLGRDLVLNRLDQWLERAEKASAMDGEEAATGAHQLL